MIGKGRKREKRLIRSQIWEVKTESQNLRIYDDGKRKRKQYESSVISNALGKLNQIWLINDVRKREETDWRFDTPGQKRIDVFNTPGQEQIWFFQQTAIYLQMTAKAIHIAY